MGGLAPKTVQLHEGHVRRRLIPFLGDKDLREIRISTVQDLHDHLLESTPPLSPRTIEMVIGTLGRILSYAEAQELVDSHAIVAWKRARGRRRSSSVKPIPRERALDFEELGRFLDVARQDFPGWYPFVLFLADTGVRLGEASALRWVDVDLQAGTARISRSFSDGQFLSRPNGPSIRPLRCAPRNTRERRRRKDPDEGEVPWRPGEGSNPRPAA